MNMKFSSDYRQYTDQVPDFLQSRPRDMVIDCMKRMNLADEAQSGDVIHVAERMYNVKGHHQLYYSVNLDMPHCTCHDWSKNIYPCKHMFMVFRFTDESFDTLPTYYLKSPWLSLDENSVHEVLPLSEALQPNDNAATMSPSSQVSFLHSSASQEVRNILRDMMNLTYL